MPGTTADLKLASIQNLGLMMCDKVERIPNIACGNVVGIVGVDKYITKQGTISDNEEAHSIRSMKYSISPVVRVTVQPRNAIDLPMIVEGLERLSQSDPLILCLTEVSGEHIVAGCYDLHIASSIYDLENKYAKCQLNKSEPFVHYNETITELSNQLCTSKSQNKHNEIFV